MKTFLTATAVLCLALTSMAASKQPLRVSEDYIKSRIIDLQEKDINKVFTPELAQLEADASTITYFFPTYDFMSFDWRGGVFDVCSDNPTVTIENVTILDQTHADVKMRYHDGDCYDIPYTLKMLSGRDWFIDDVIYEDPDLDAYQSTERMRLAEALEPFYNASSAQLNQMVKDVETFCLESVPYLKKDIKSKDADLASQTFESASNMVNRILDFAKLIEKHDNYSKDMGKRLQKLSNMICKELKINNK
ncbi:MAG: hypothetical protein IK092_01630 [Muribaculaceae bacterium]|nr:hypothetical protein [Muribaculaceae bacterium]